MCLQLLHFFFPKTNHFYSGFVSYAKLKIIK
jgi:hypothetical protein